MSQSKESVLEEALIGLYKAATEDFGVDPHALLNKAVLQIHQSHPGDKALPVDGMEEASYALQEILDTIE